MWGEKVKFACKVFRIEHAQIPGYPLVKDHWYTHSELKLNDFYVIINHYFWIVINTILTQNGSSDIGVCFPDIINYVVVGNFVRLFFHGGTQ